MLVRAEGRFPYRGPPIATLTEIDGGVSQRLRTICQSSNDETLALTAIGQQLALVFEKNGFFVTPALLMESTTCC
jgi:hypothetical protein